MSDYKDRMIEAVERGWCGERDAYTFVADQYAAAADDQRTRAKEAGYRNPLVAPYFCQTCHWSDTAHPRDECGTGFIAGDPETVRAANRALGFTEG